MRIVYFGTPQFAADVLDYLLDHGIDVAAVVTRPDKPKGRSGTAVATPVKQVALDRGLTVHQPERCSHDEFVEVLATYKADLFIVVAYGEIVKDNVLNLPPLGCVNLHASLLPKYRGAAPIHRCIIDGETETGVSIMYMVRAMDAGDVIRQDKVAISPNMTTGELEMELRQVGAESLLKAIQDLFSGPVTAVPQEHDKATLAPKIELEDCQIDWSQPSQTVHDLVRGSNPFPGAWCWISLRGQKKRLKVLRTEIISSMQGIPGEILAYGDQGLIVACSDSAIRFLEIKPEGKRAMSAESWMRGFSQDALNFVEQSL